jgi:NAD(P)-dependent dehydrogenase (short-subunit alcohol dehydrogenase family)
MYRIKNQWQLIDTRSLENSAPSTTSSSLPGTQYYRDQSMKRASLMQRTSFECDSGECSLQCGTPVRRFQPGGSIVLTSSTLPKRPVPGLAIGASISAAVEALAASLAVELAPIRVNVVAPGIIRTELWNRLPEEQRENYFAIRSKALPLGRVGKTSDVAEAYLSFMRSPFTTGQTLVVDGGMLLV